MFEVSVEDSKTVMRVSGQELTQTLRYFIFEMFTLVTSDVRHKLCIDSGAEFTVNPSKMYTPDRYLLVTFAKPEGAQAFVDYVNKHTFLKNKDTVTHLMRLATRFRQADASTNYDQTYKDLQDEIYNALHAADEGKDFTPTVQL